MAALASSAALTACGAADSTANVTLARDSAGIAIVENREPRADWRLADEPDVRVGVLDGDAAYQFNRVAYAARLADGRVVVADGGTLELRYFDASGRHLTTVGRRGGGPREFQAFTTLRLGAGDTLLAYDWRNRRITRVSPDPAVAAEVPVDWAGLITPATAAVLGMRGDGRALVVSGPEHDVSILRTGYRYARDSVFLLAVAPDGSAADTLSRMPSREHLIWMDQRNGQWRTMMLDLPFGHGTHHALLGDRLVRAATERDQLELLDADGRLTHLVRRVDSRAMPVGDADRERYVAEVRARAEATNAPNLPMIVEGAREQVGHLPAGQMMPAFDRVLTDGAGRIWVRDHVPLWATDEPQHWTLFDGGGAAVACVTTPAGFDVLHVAGEHVTGVVRDELDVEYVAVYRIEAEP